LTFYNLKYFLAITEEGNISKAADRLHISQQSLSEQLQKLETEVGAQLMKRGHSMALTPAGKILAYSATKMLGTYNEMLDEIAAISNKDKTKITLAVPTTQMPPFLPGLLTEFSAEYPEYEVKIIRCQPMESAKYAKDFDLYFSTLPLSQELEHVPILEGDTYAVAIASSLAERIYGERWPDVEAQLLEKRDISTLHDMPFILLRNKLDNVVLDQEIIFQEAGFVPRITFQSENGELNSNMCVLGAGAYVSTMDYCHRRFFDNIGKGNGILLYPIDTAGIAPIMIALSYRKGMCLTKADNCFIRVAKKYLQTKPTAL